MTKAEKAEEKARRKAELAAQTARRKVQLDALKNYWFFRRYDIGGRACPQDFFLFWVRQFLFISQKVFAFLLNQGGDILRHIYFLPVGFIVVAVLALIFPPVLTLVEIILLSFAIGMILVTTVALLVISAYMPFFLAEVKRRINDVSNTAVVARARFTLFMGSGVLFLLSFGVCLLSWCNVAAFAAEGILSWLVDIAYALMLVGLGTLIGQMHYYTYKAGVSGVNFAGANPTEVPLTEEALVERGNNGSSRSWQLFSLVLICCAIVISFSLSSLFLRFISMFSEVDGILGSLRGPFFPFLVYGPQVVAAAAFIFVVCTRGRYAKGNLGVSEIASINDCFIQKSAAYACEMKEKAMRAAEDERREHTGVNKSFFDLIDLPIRSFLSFFYYGLLVGAVFYLFKDGLALAVMMSVMAFAAVACYNYFKSNVEKGIAAINWNALMAGTGKQLLNLGRNIGRNIVLLPFSLSDHKTSESSVLPTITAKRLRIRNLSLVDPLGIHQFALGEMELGCVQILFCLLIIGIPISWLWSIFDGARFSRMSDEGFLVKYSNYCLGNGMMDKIVRLMSKISIRVAPIAGASVLLAFTCTLDNTSASGESGGAPKGTLAIKGLYIGMTGDRALKTYKKLIGGSKDLMVVDFRSGIGPELDEETKARQKKSWEETIKLAEADIDRFLQWHGIHGGFYDPSREDCEGREADERDIRPYVAGGSTGAPIPGANWVVGSAMVAFAGANGYQVEWMLPGKRKGGKHGEQSVPKLYSGKVEVPAGNKKYSDPYSFWNSEVLGKGLVKELYSKGLQLSKENEKRAFFRLVLEDAKGNPIDKAKVAEELVFNNPKFFEEFDSRQGKVAAAEKEVEGFGLWVEFLRSQNFGDYSINGVSLFAPENSRAGKAVKEAKAADAASLAKKNRTDLKFLTAARTGSFRSVTSNYAVDFAKTMMKMACNCKIMLEWAVLTEPADKLEEIVETVVIPADGYESAVKFASKLNSDLGINGFCANDSLRTRRYFEKELVDVRSPLWFRLVLKTTNGVEVAKADAVKNWLEDRGQFPPDGRMKISKKQVIEVAFNNGATNEKDFRALSWVTLDKDGNVRKFLFNESGLDRFFKAKDIPGEDLAQALVDHYSELPCLIPNVKRVDLERNGLLIQQETTWTHEDPKGYRIDLFERAYHSLTGISQEQLLDDPQVALSLSLAGKLPTKWLTVYATQSESAGKFD